ncbi:MAG: DUF1835 domain-containing protein [Thalassospira sp.]|uniref:DUF1835 domain-containing protein n=1 Tax=Thalassospira sp. TaxID=1912094 RepID=UPI0032EC4FA2
MSALRTSKSDKAQNTQPASSTPPIRERPIFDGRLNLEQQRKRAKELLRDLQNGKPGGLTRFKNAGHPVSHPEIPALKLADAQLVIARENGFTRWPKMKAHIDKISERNRQIAQGTLPTLDAKTTLHLRCGSDIRHGIEIAGFVGDFLEFADPFCQGPVPDLPRDQFIQTRANFIADAYHITPKDALARSHREYASLATLGDYEQVVLWFEHDSYDQLILAFLMDFIATTRPKTQLEVISVGEVPGIDRFIGLGQLSPELLIWCWENHRMPVTDEMLHFGRDAWSAIRSQTPDLLESFIKTAPTKQPLPHMIKAFKRHYAELPDRQSGLGLTQQLTLQIIKTHGPITVGKVFGHLMRTYDPLPYLGDLMFWADVQRMMECKDPLFTITSSDPDQNWAERTITLTETGEATLAGKTSFLENFSGIRWVGGIQVTNTSKQDL